MLIIYKNVAFFVEIAFKEQITKGIFGIFDEKTINS